MTELLAYSLAVSIPLALLWLAYRSVFAGGRNFGVNRIMLLSIYVIALLLFPAIGWVDRFVFSDEVTLNMVPEDGGFSVLTGIMNVASILWLAGSCVALTATFADWFRIIRIISKSSKTDEDGLTVYLADDRRLAPFSIWGVMVMSREDYAVNNRLVTAHEAGHIKMWHSLDMLLAQAVGVLCWYNPAAWLMKRELKTVHEFQADAYAIAGGCDVVEYQMLLINKVAKSDSDSGMSNRLGGSVLKKRLKMMDGGGMGNRKVGWRYGIVVVALFASGMILRAPESSAILRPARVFVDTDEPEAGKNFPMEIYVDGELVEYEDINSIPAGEIKAITVDKNKDRMDISLR